MGSKFNPLIFSGIDLTGNGGGGPAGAVQWKSPVSDEANLPIVGNSNADARVVLSTDKIYVWDATTSKWVDSGLTVASFGSTPNAEGLSVSTISETVGSVDVTRTAINLEPADETNPGAVSTTDQTFGGIKTFASNIVVIGDVDAKGGVESSTGTLDIGTDSVMTSVINIGHATSTVVIAGTTLYENVEDLLVKDKTITLNDGGTDFSAGDAGIEIEENSSITGYVKVSSDRNTWELKAPGQLGVAVIDGGLDGITLSQSTEELLPLDGSRPMTGSIIMDVNSIEFDDGAGTTLVVDPSSIGFDFDGGAGITSSADYTSSYASLSTSDGLVTQTFSATPLGMESIYSDSSTGISEASVVNPSGLTQNSETPSSSRTILLGSANITMDTVEGVDSGQLVVRQIDSVSSEIYTNKNLSIESVLDLQLTSSGGNIYINNELSLTSNKIVDVLDPTDPQDAATKAYVDSLTTAVSEVTKEPTGFPNRTDSIVTFSDLSRTLTITPTGSSFDVYVKGQKFTKSEEEITLTEDSGNHYIYYNDSGVLTDNVIFDPSIFTDNALVAIVYWNNDTGSVYFAEERHGLTMDGATHGYLHTVFGARFISGLTLEGFSVDGTGNDASDAQFTSDLGKIRDEDLLIEIAQQNEIPILYREGTLWRKKAADSFPVIYSGTAGYTSLRLPYNNFNGTSWSLQEVVNNGFVLVHFFGTNDKDNGVIGIQGTSSYGDVTAARNAASTEISSLSGLPFAEFVAIGSVVFQTSNGYTNAPKARVRSVDSADYVDFRGTQLYTPAGEATTHSLLSGLANDDHIQYVLASGARSMSGDLDMGTHKINNVVDGVANDDVATVGQLNAAITGTTSYFAGFDSITGGLTEVPGYTFDDSGTLQIGAQNSITIPPTITDYTSISISPTVSNPGLTSLAGVQLNSPIDHTVSNYSGFQAFGYGASAPDNFTGYLSQPAYSGTGTNITHFSASGSADCSGDFIGLSVTSSSDANIITGVNVSTTGNSTTLTGVQVSPSGTHTDATGLKIDLTSATVTNRPVAADISGGSFSTTETFQANPALVVDSGNVLRPVFEVQPLSPLSGTTDVIMNNLAGFMDFKDDFTSGPIGIGVTSVGFVSQVAATAGSDVDKISMMTAGLAVDSTSSGGTVTDAHLMRGFATGFGGSLTIDNLYGLQIADGLSSVATNAYGISVEDTSADNFLAKSLTIGGTAKQTTNNEIALEVDAVKSIRLGRATTIQIAGLSNLSGLLIYDSNTNKYYGNDGSGWKEIQYALGSADIARTYFQVQNNIVTPAPITGFVFDNSTVRGFEAQVTITRGSNYAEYSLKGIQKGSSWEMSQDYIGDDTGVVFSIDSSGQVQYTSSNSVVADLYFRANTV